MSRLGPSSDCFTSTLPATVAPSAATHSTGIAFSIAMASATDVPFPVRNEA
ncbi:MAG TPA: hypothetical protein VFJ50_03805 [Gemmatimonadales bacterium]|nr:hypothetical protein [Gemmatimonadales bacterium]